MSSAATITQFFNRVLVRVRQRQPTHNKSGTLSVTELYIALHPSIHPSIHVFISRKCPHNENNNARKMTMLNGIPNRRGRPSVRLRCSIIPNLNTGIYNSTGITNQTINYDLHNTAGEGL